jgi:DNA-binding transcriptional ArsR family regulator
MSFVREPGWLRGYEEGDPQVLTTLDRALRTFHTTCLAPRWTAVTARFHRDVIERSALIRRYGIFAMFNTLSPHLHLSGMTLEGRYPWERHVNLSGQGLVLMPSAFWTRYPLITWDPQEQSRYVLIYPAQLIGDQQRERRADARPEHDALATLLGPTRAAVLRALQQPFTTSALARQLGISSPAASMQAAALRGAGLVTSERHGQAVIHQVTELGSALLWQGD